MHLSTREEYGLRCLVHLARHQAPEPLTIPEIAAGEGIGPEYIAKIMRALRQGKLVVSTRGSRGGYRLARPSAAITAWEVIEVLDGSFFSDGFCESHSGRRRDCVHTVDCTIRGLLRVVNGALGTLLGSVTLADLAAAHGERSIEMRFKGATMAQSGIEPPAAGPLPGQQAGTHEGITRRRT